MNVQTPEQLAFQDIAAISAECQARYRERVRRMAEVITTDDVMFTEAIETAMAESPAEWARAIRLAVTGEAMTFALLVSSAVLTEAKELS